MGMAQAARLNLRMQKELKLLLTDPPPGASFPTLSDGGDSSLTSIDAMLQGPEGTVYSSGVFEIKIQIPERYPFQPPIVTFSTPIYHPNIDNGGRICLDILNLPPKWKPKSRIEVACLFLLQAATDVTPGNKIMFSGMWQPSLNISTVLTSICLLLTEPNPDDGLMHDASRDYKYNRQAFDQNARSMTEKYAQAGMTDIARNGNGGQIHIGQSTSQIKIEGSVASACISEHRKLSLQSPGCSNNRRNGEEEMTKAPAHNSSMDHFEIGPRKEASKDSSICTVNFGKLHATRYELSAKVSIASHSRNGKSENANLSNQSSSQNSSDFSEPLVRASIRDEDQVERSHSISVSKGLQSFRVRTKLSRVSDEKSQNIIQHTGSPLDSVRPQELSLKINHNKTNPPKDAIASKGNCSTSINLKKRGLVGLKPSSELHLSGDKENLAPLRCLLPQVTDQDVALAMTSESNTCCNKTEGMEATVAPIPFEPSVKVLLKTLNQQVGSNSNVILHDVRSCEKKHVVQSAIAFKQHAEGSQSQAPDAVIVLDSEDSDEENVPLRSKLMLTRRCLSRKRKLGL